MKLLLAVLFLPLAAFGQAYTFADRAWLGNARPAVGGAPAAPAFGGGVGYTNAASSSASTSQIAVTNTVAAGTRVVVTVHWIKNASTIVSSISDTAGNTYSRDGSKTNTDSGVKLDIWSAPVTSGLSSGNTITVNWNEGVAGAMQGAAIYLTGVSSADVTTNVFGLVNGAVTCTATTTAANVSVGLADSSNVNEVYTPSWTTYAKDKFTNANAWGYTIYNVNASGGSLNMNGSTTENGWFAAVWVDYK